MRTLCSNSGADRPATTLSMNSGFRKSPHSRANKLLRTVWQIAYRVLFRPSPRNAHKWRCALLRTFGASIGSHVRIYPSARVWAPWNLDLGDWSCVGESVNCYSVGKIVIGAYATISQTSELITATHDYAELHLPLLVDDIAIGNHAWVCAHVIIMPGVAVGEGAVVGVRSTVFDDIPNWKVAVGTPCKAIRERLINAQ